MALSSIFYPFRLDITDKQALDRDGHLVLPSIITEQASQEMTRALTEIQPLRESKEPVLSHHSGYAGEYDPYLGSLIAHPQMLELMHRILGPEIRFDHCCTINRPAGHPGFGWHSHEYADQQPELGLIRIFFYLNGFSRNDAALKVVAGSHLYRDGDIGKSVAPTGSDKQLIKHWLQDKTHPYSGQPLEIEVLEVPPRTAILMWTHAAHAVNARQPGSPTRWTVVYGYRNPGVPSSARRVSQGFEQNPPPGLESLLPAY